MLYYVNHSTCEMMTSTKASMKLADKVIVGLEFFTIYIKERLRYDLCKNVTSNKLCVFTSSAFSVLEGSTVVESISEWY